MSDSASTLETRMVRIELTSQEAEELRSILDDYLSDLRMQIVDTEGHDFRVMLKKRKDLVKRLLEQLKGQKAWKSRREAPRFPSQDGERECEVASSSP